MIWKFICNCLDSGVSPFAASRHLTSADDTSAAAVSTGAMKRILLVDDQAHVLRVMRLSLDRNGYEVDTALDGELALSMLQERHYDVLITDCELSHMNGRTLCEHVRARYQDESPLMLVMADGDKRQASSAENLSWIENLPNTEPLDKPVSLRWIVARLNEFFGDYNSPSIA